MELWIRSQNKRSLIKAESVICSNTGYVLVNNITMGSYETEQRALEILDEIQRLIVNCDKTILTTSSDLDQKTYDEILEEVEKNNFTILSCVNTPQVFPLNQNIVYQMPEK